MSRIYEDPQSDTFDMYQWCGSGAVVLWQQCGTDSGNSTNGTDRKRKCCASGGFFLACEDLGRMFHNSFPTEISSRKTKSML